MSWKLIGTILLFNANGHNKDVYGRTSKRKAIKVDGKFLHAWNNGNCAMEIEWDNSTTQIESRKSKKRSCDLASVHHDMEITEHRKRTKMGVVIERKVNFHEMRVRFR